MSLIVQKYGGTSVGNPERIKNVARRLIETQQAGNQVVAVVSAMSGVTIVRGVPASQSTNGANVSAVGLVMTRPW